MKVIRPSGRTKFFHSSVQTGFIESSSNDTMRKFGASFMLENLPCEFATFIAEQFEC